MRPLTAGQVAARVGAEVVGDPSVLIGPEVIIDSRKVSPGCLFVALAGERVDGHDFVGTAAAAGAAAVLVGRELDVDATMLVVSDPAAALAALASAVVRSAVDDGLTTVAITGSSGKTSTKDLLAQILADAGPTVAPVGSQNNEIGVPLTATRVDADTRFLVSEFGARGIGHIAWLCEVVPPQIGVVVNVGQAHLGEFGDQATIARAKGELVEALPAAGWAVLNADDALVAAMVERTPARIATFAVGAEPGFGEQRVWSDQAESDDRLRHRFTVHASGVLSGSAPVQLQVSGAHQVANALAAVAAALACGVSLDAAAASLSRATAQSRWRMELHDTPGGGLVINDAYNANPDSMAAALRSLAGLRRPSGRLVAILGDMLELGPESGAHHRAVGELAAAVGVEVLIAVGDQGDEMAAGAAAAGLVAVEAADAAAAADVAVRLVRRGDVVLVKASRGLALETVAQRLLVGAAAESER
ncbi:MAG: UDP-N-acetylmuramoyl-tripeptide--D-alanyl-D-alanine ligase [Propionibacteriales bacterium]|nr:UDP-N-acetylmuramoyl-tripeptide--D-alanyl-D-alanine ligase [Propionibacteriales bacterium]